MHPRLLPFALSFLLSLAARAAGLPDLPRPIASFGAAVLGDHAYVYGGHIGKQHTHSRDNLSDAFARISLAEPAAAWERLPMRETVQGHALVAWQDRVLRIGGVHSRNATGEKADMHSSAAVESFDPATGTWTVLTRLPEARSSFDAAVAGDVLYVIGGWTLAGNPRDGTWSDGDWRADLRADPLVWQKVPAAPTPRRALAVAADAQRLIAVGGLAEDGNASLATQVLDLATLTWSNGPDYPDTGNHKAFGASAVCLGGVFYASAGDGKTHRWKPGDAAWTEALPVLDQPRFFHRLVVDAPRNRLVYLAGSSAKGHLATSEFRPLPNPAPTGAANWPGFRGGGVEPKPARGWPKGEAVREWTVDLAGYGQSSPVIWNGRVFTTSIEGPNKEKLHVQAWHLESGKPAWQQTFDSGLPAENNDYVSKAAPTPCVDGERVYVAFESGDLIALTHEGGLVWRRNVCRDYGDWKGNHGSGSSPVLTSAGLVWQVDHDGPSYLLCLDPATGATRWKTDHGPRMSWTTPVVRRTAAREEIIVSSNGRVEAVDAANGIKLWWMDEVKGNTIASATLAGNLCIIGGADKGTCLAVPLDRAGEVPPDAAAWRAAEPACSMMSPVVVGDRVCFVNKAGVLMVCNLKDGATVASTRLPTSCWATPIPASGRLWFFGKEGAVSSVDTTTLDQAEVREEERLDLGGRVYAVAVAGDAWLVRAGTRLLCRTWLAGP